MPPNPPCREWPLRLTYLYNVLTRNIRYVCNEVLLLCRHPNPPKKLKRAVKSATKKTKTDDKTPSSSANVTAKQFIERLKALQSPKELEKIQRYFKSGEGEYGEGDVFMGVRMGSLFKLSEEFIDMPPKEIEKLLESPIHEVRAGAVSIMNKQGRNKKTTESRRKELYDLYLQRHDRINNWDLVDLGATFVIGRYLFDKPRKCCTNLLAPRTCGNAAPRL